MFSQTVQTVTPQKLQTNKTLSEPSNQDMLDSFITKNEMRPYFKLKVQFKQVFSEKSFQSYLKERQNTCFALIVS